MSSAKAQLESDTRVLAWEAGREYGVRVNTISAGPLKSRAASAIGKEKGKKTFIEYAIDYSKTNSPLGQVCALIGVLLTDIAVCVGVCVVIVGVIVLTVPVLLGRMCTRCVAFSGR